MRFPSKETVERIRKEYPVGTRVELVRMEDYDRFCCRKGNIQSQLLSEIKNHWMKDIRTQSLKEMGRS